MQLAGELTDLSRRAPSLDAIGVNAYYEEHIDQLDRLMWAYGGKRPYVVTEVGPFGYWDEELTPKTGLGALIEPTPHDKTAKYVRHWNEYVEEKRGLNLGGFVYAWQDRMEGTQTWFGLTDYKGRLKPAYYALREAWTGEPVPPDLPFVERIAGPEVVAPGSSAEFVAEEAGPRDRDVSFEWELRRDDILARAGSIRPLGDGRAISLEPPEQTGSYRLYVYVADERGNVDTASLGILVGPPAGRNPSTDARGGSG